ncbi:MAG: pyridoxal-phosphate dependent enzyme [Deltaproteobacteria bacterium]|nr:pyridoxal-phosphate dependent enzyme [Deltaproteobacteria bacterium]
MSHLVCHGCGAVVSLDDPTPFRCPNRSDQPDVDHILVRHLDPNEVDLWPPFDDNDHDANPFSLYRDRWHTTALARAHGLSNDDLTKIIDNLDAQIAAVWGKGFRVTPLVKAPPNLVAAASGTTGTLWLKDETENVSGSHKARHLAGIMLHLEVARATLGYRDKPPLAIASCGNAALAAAVVARAVDWPLDVYIPTDAPESVVEKLRDLRATLHVMPRDDKPGDPCYRGFQEALKVGSLPFCCQGPDNGLCIEGGKTLGYELIDQLEARGSDLDALFVQVGGGALASACTRSLLEAYRSGRLRHLPRLYTVQTGGAHPLARAHARLLDRFPAAEDPANDKAISGALRYAATHRGDFMWPWEHVPKSIAHGILDDETYDWLVIVEGMLRSGGTPLVVDEDTLREAHAHLRATTAIEADPTGTSGLAGWIVARKEGLVGPAETSAVLITGHER